MTTKGWFLVPKNFQKKKQINILWTNIHMFALKK